jgi:hypothetical protein
VQRLKQEEEYKNEKRGQRDLVAAGIKSGYNPGPRSFMTSCSTIEAYYISAVTGVVP